MKVSCDVIRDILPLYVEDMVSDDTRILVEDHLMSCQPCKNTLEQMREPQDILVQDSSIDTDLAPLKKIKSKIKKKKLQAIIVSILFTAIVCFSIFGFLTAPEYIPYNPGVVSFNKNHEGIVVAVFDSDIGGYDINKYPSEVGDGYSYHITAWNSILNTRIITGGLKTIMLNPDGEIVDSVYYYNTDGNEDKLIYGRSQYINGGVVTLPRLFLSYYLLIALVSIGILLVLTLMFRKNKKIRNFIWKIIFLPLSYIIGHLIIKGVKTSSYLGAKDFYGIVLVTIPLYLISLLVFDILME